ncbi:MAG: RluA family pseudouridine synthase [Endomicrobiales bacterium]|nr:RluA family pseudouridine synthase [Endomicrobiales bacterium]
MKIKVDQDGLRIDVFLAKRLPDYSRGYLQKLIKSGNVLLDSTVPSPHRIVRAGETVELTVPKEEKKTAKGFHAALDVIFEDENVLLIDKAPGMVVHPAAGHEDDTLLNAVVAYAGGKFVPYMVHRLDKDTSGVMIIAKNEKAKHSIVRQFQNKAVKKVYLAAVKGFVGENKGRIEAPLGRAPGDRKKIIVGPLAKKHGITEFLVRFRAREFSILEVHPMTGRTHQIRSHMLYIGHPVLGDVFYGAPCEAAGYRFARQMLHAYKIKFSHPETGGALEFTAPVPDDMRIIKDNIKT